MKLNKKSIIADGENGAVIIEASIALPFFMFMMITLYSIIQIAYVQARMSVAVDCAAKELAEYAHVYFATGMNESFSGSGGKSSAIADEVGDFLKTMSEGSISEEMGQFIGGAGEAISGDSISNLFKNGISEAISMQMLKKNMVNGPGDSAETFQKRNHIKNMNMIGSKVLSDGREIFLCVNYDVEVIRLFKLKYSFHFINCAYTEAWGKD